MQLCCSITVISAKVQLSLCVPLTLFVGTHGSLVERIMRRDAVPVYFPVCSDAVSFVSCVFSSSFLNVSSVCLFLEEDIHFWFDKTIFHTLSLMWCTSNSVNLLGFCCKIFFRFIVGWFWLSASHNIQITTSHYVYCCCFELFFINIRSLFGPTVLKSLLKWESRSQLPIHSYSLTRKSVIQPVFFIIVSLQKKERKKSSPLF